MSTTTTTIYDLAREAADCFTGGTRPNGDEFRTLRDDRPDWVYEAVRAAHGDTLPDDWLYACIEDAFNWIADYEPDPLDDGSGEFADSTVDMYTQDLIVWLGSHLSRIGYCDEAADAFGWDKERGIIGMIALGQYMEAEEVYRLVARALEDEFYADADA